MHRLYPTLPTILLFYLFKECSFFVPIATSLYTTYGEASRHGAVVKLEKGKDERHWMMGLYINQTMDLDTNGKPTLRPEWIHMYEVDGTAKDPLTGRLLIDELREVQKSKLIIHLRYTLLFGDRKARAIEAEDYRTQGGPYYLRPPDPP